MSTAELLDQLATAVRRDASGRRRLVALAASALALLVVGGVGVAGTYDDWWTGNAPAVQAKQIGAVAAENDSVGIHLDLSKKAAVARTDDAVLDAVATNGGRGYCLSLFVGAGQLGSSCATAADSEYRSRADDSHWLGYGRILDTRAAALDLSGAGLSSHVPLERGGFFLFEIPRREWAGLDGRSGDISILDTDGKTIRRACIFVGLAPPSPYAGGGALGERPGTCDVLKPIVPNPELDRARKLVSLTLSRPHATLAAGETVSLWRAPNRGGGYCWLLGPTPARRDLSGCAREEPRLVDGHLSVEAGDGLVSGWAPAGSGIVRVTVGGVDAALGHGAFLGEAGEGPVVVVGYDAAGVAVARSKLPA